MPTIDEYAHRPREERLTRIARTPSELAAAVRGAGTEGLARRPAPKSWAATEVICHLRDNEEWFLERMKLVVAMDQPRFVATNPDRWAEERQYLTSDAAGALAAFTRRREETLEFLQQLGRHGLRRPGVRAGSCGRPPSHLFLSVVLPYRVKRPRPLSRPLARLSVHP